MAARAALMVAARRVSNPPTVTPPALTSPAVRRIPRRGLAGGADPHGPPKVNFWEDPLSPSKWKEEHFVIVSLAGCGLIFYGGYKLLSGRKEETKEGTVRESSQ